MHHNDRVEQIIQTAWKDRGLRDLAVKTYGEENLPEVALLIDALSKTGGSIIEGANVILSVVSRPTRDLTFAGEQFQIDMDRLKKFPIHDAFFTRAMDLLHPPVGVHPRSMQNLPKEYKELAAGSIPSGILTEVVRRLQSRM